MSSITNTAHSNIPMVPLRILLIGDDSTKSERDQVAEFCNKNPQQFPKGAVARPRFQNAADLAKAVTAGPSAIVAIDDPSEKKEAPQQQPQQQQQQVQNAHLFRLWKSASFTAETAARKIAVALADNSKMLRPVFCSTRDTSKDRASSATTFLGAIRQGLAVDGGLFMPDRLPSDVNLAALQQVAHNQGYAAMAVALLEQLVDVCQVPPGVLSNMVEIAYRPDAWSTSEGAIMPLRKLLNGDENSGSNSSCGAVYLAELFHGPTAAFKDFALQLFPQMFAQSMLERDVEMTLLSEGNSNNDNGKNESNKKDEGEEGDTTAERYMILAATSGDTGVSAIRGFMSGAQHVKVMVLYPKAGVSPVQREQMLACHGGNVAVLGVDGDFDLCQSTVKQIFNDAELSKTLLNQCGTKLSSANSINWGRLLPQIAYYFWTSAMLVPKSGGTTSPATFDVVVPTGNFGNILAGYFAKQLGCNIGKLVLASNTNDVLCDFVRTGVYDISGRSLKTTASPSIDILKASNVERLLFHLSGRDSALVAQLMKQLDTEKKFTVPEAVFNRMQEDFVSYRCSEKECSEEVKLAADLPQGVLLDPHTAVAVHAAKLFRKDRNQSKKDAHDGENNNNNNGSNKSSESAPIVVMATAHWAKFPDAVQQAMQAGTFPPAESSNKIPAEAVPKIYEAVLDAMKKKHEEKKATGIAADPLFVAEPLAKVFANLGQHTAVHCSGKYEDIKNAVLSFAMKK